MPSEDEIRLQISRINERLKHVPAFRFSDYTTGKHYEIYTDGYVFGLENGGFIHNGLLELQIHAITLGKLEASLQQLHPQSSNALCPTLVVETV